MVPKHFSENNRRRTCLFLGCLFPNLYWIVLILAMLDITNYMRSLQSLFIGSGDLSRAVTWTLCVTKNWHIRVTVMNFLIDPSLGPITTHKSGPASVHLLTEQTC